jgi:ribokinase
VSARRVVVIGDVMLDVVVKRSSPLARTSDTPARVRISRGGSGANLSVALGNAGHHVVYVGACGDDAPRKIFEEELAVGGVHANLQLTSAATGVVVALVDEDGQRAMLTDRGANSLLTEPFVMRQLNEPFDHLHVSGYTILDPATRDLAAAALRFARETGRSSSVDVCSVGPLTDVTPEIFLEATRESSMVFANEEEALVLSRRGVVDDALTELSEMFDEVVITRGPLGAVASCGNERASVAPLGSNVVDTTGAGDAATGAYLGARLRGASLDDALELAMAASAEVVRGLGARG